MEILTLDEAAELLRVTRRTMRQLAQAGAVPGRHVGKAWRFSRRALLDFVTRGERTRRGEASHA